MNKEKIKNTHGLAILTLILAFSTILGLLYSLLGLFLIFLTIVLGIISLVEIKKDKNLSGQNYVYSAFGVVILIFLLSSVLAYEQNFAQKNKISCINLGCSSDTVAVGNFRSKVWFYCNCKGVDYVQPKNIRCFTSTNEAEHRGYKQTNMC